MRVKRAYNSYDKSVRLIFKCPGCTGLHQVCIDAGEGKYPVWEFNGDMDTPTINPSLLVTLDLSNGQPEYIHEPHFKGVNICHSYIRDGKIQFLDDSTHPLKGQTVDLIERDYDEYE